MPETDNDPDHLRNALVDSIKQRTPKISAPVEEALRAIPRHHFLPGFSLSDAYKDDAIVTQRTNGISTSSSSQPSLMAFMLDQLHLQPGQRILEIGAGTGFNAALIARIVGQQGHVTSIEIDPEVATLAKKALHDLRTQNVTVITGDGFKAHAPNAPYHAIILTAASRHISPDWCDQLAPDGYFVGPLFLRDIQHCIAFRKTENQLISETIFPVAFMQMRHAAGDLPPKPVLFEFCAPDAGIEPNRVAQLLRSPREFTQIRLTATARELMMLRLWLALRSPQSCSIAPLDQPSEFDALIPRTFAWGSQAETFGLVSPSELCLIAPPSGETPKPDEPREICLHTFGNQHLLHQQMQEEITTWHQRGRGQKTPLKLTATRNPNPTPMQATHTIKAGDFFYHVEWI